MSETNTGATEVIEEEQIEVDEVTEVIEGEEEKFDIEGLTEGEIELAKEHGLYEDGAEEKVEEEVKEEKEKKTPTVEEVEKDKELLKEYSKEERGLFRKYKLEKQRKQDLRNDLVDRGLARINEKSGSLEFLSKSDLSKDGNEAKQIETIRSLLKDPDTLTVEAIQEALDSKPEVKEESSVDNGKKIQQKVAVKASIAEEIGNENYENFEHLSNLAKEVMNDDESGTYQKIIDDAFISDNVEADQLVERVVRIAKMHPKYSDEPVQVATESTPAEKRVVSNANKKQSSASVKGGSGKRIISEAELTADQAERLSKEQWNKLKDSTKKRIMMG